jgi:putative transposase
MELSFTSQNASFAFGQHDRVTIEGARYCVTSRNEEGYVLTRDDGTGLSVQFAHAQLSRLASARRIRVERDYYDPRECARRLRGQTSMVTTLPDKARARVSKRDAYCEAVEKLRREGTTIKMTDESLRANMTLIMGTALEYVENLNPLGTSKPDVSADLRKAPSTRTLRRWLQDKKKLGLAALAGAMHRRGNRGSAMGPEALGLLWKEVRGYLTVEKPTQKMIHENVVLAFQQRNAERAEEGLDPLAIPSRETVRRAIHSLDPFEVECARNGVAAARKKFRPVADGLHLTRPLERVEADEWTVDLMTLLKTAELDETLTDEEKLAMGLDGSKGRLVLSVIICCTTRCIVGMTLCKAASAESALSTLQMVVSDKGKWADAVGALSAWDLYGLPEHLVTDGASHFKSQTVRNACADLGIAFEIATNGVPEVRGTVERVFKTIANDLMPRLSGRTFSDIITKGDTDPRDRAALTVDDLTFALIRWVVDIYHNTPHRSLGGETPLDCWRRLNRQYGVQPPPDSEHTRLVFGTQDTRRLDKTGITVLGVRYHSDVLATWMLRRDPEQVEVRWHPMDIGGISVRLGSEWYTIPAVDDSLDGVPARTWLTAVRHVRAGAPKSSRVDMVAVREAIKAIDARTAASMAAAGINVEDWSPEAMARAERKNFAGVEFFERKAPQKADAEPGHAIPDLSEVTGEDDTAATSGTSSAGATGPRPGKSNLTIEED